MSAAHTPGPWLLAAACGLVAQWIDTESGLHIASVRVDDLDSSREARYCATTPYPQGRANARLIAAAPDLELCLAETAGMLAACIDIAGGKRPSQAAVEHLRAQHTKCLDLLAKAGSPT